MSRKKKKNQKSTNPTGETLSEPVPMRFFQEDINALQKFEETGLPLQFIIRRCVKEHWRDVLATIQKERQQILQNLENYQDTPPSRDKGR